MTDTKLIEDLKGFDDAVLCLIVRDGELKIGAQLQVANAADARAMSFAGFTAATSTASVAGVIYLNSQATISVGILVAAVITSIGLIISLILAILSARSTKFGFPGSRPGTWTPDQWQNGNKGPHTLKQAMLEQALCIDQHIRENEIVMKSCGKMLNRAIYTALGSVVSGALIVAHTMLFI